MISKKAIETEKKSNKACLVVTITIVVLLNLGVFFFYDEISEEVSFQYDKYFSDKHDDLIFATTMMTLNSNEKDTTKIPEMATDPTEAATTTTTTDASSQQVSSTNYDEEYTEEYKDFIELDSDEDQVYTDDPNTTTTLAPNTTTTQAPNTTTTQAPNMTTTEEATTITTGELESSGSGDGWGDDDEDSKVGNRYQAPDSIYIDL